MIDTVPVISPSLPEARPEVDARVKQARYLVAEYLHDWGLRDPEVIAQESRRIVEEAELRIAESVRPDLELSSVAIEMTQREVEASIARMAASSQAPVRQRKATNNSIVPRLGPVLLEFPDAIRHRDRPPSRLLQMLERSVNPIVPCSSPCEMRPQPRTRLLKLLRRAYWVRVRRLARKLTRRYVGL